MIKTDPSQTKAVVLLLLILGAAVAWTVIRVSPGAQRQAAASPAAAETAQAYSGDVSVQPAFEPSRNPFRRPAIISVARGASGRSEIGLGAAMVQEGGREKPLGVSKIGPMPFAMVRTTGPEGSPTGGSSDNGGQSPSPDSSSKDKTETEKPPFELLATVEGSNGFTAVIRCGESDTRVVAEGDLLDGGYKVFRLGTGLAVLRPSTSSTSSGWSGRDTIVLKRPS